MLLPIQVSHDAPCDGERVFVVHRVMVCDPGLSGVDFRAAQIFGRYFLACGRLHQRRAAKEDRRLLAHHDGFVGHRRHIGAACRAGPHHAGNLRNAGSRHVGLVEEDPAEMVAVWKDLVLVRQVRTAGVDEIDARKVVLQRNLLRPKVLLHGHRIVGAALHRGVVDDDHDLAPLDAADAGDHARRGDILGIHVPRRKLADFQERRAGIQELGQSVPREQLSALHMALARLVRSALFDGRRLAGNVGDQRAHALGICLEGFGRCRNG